MRALKFFPLLCLLAFFNATAASAPNAKVVKVLPQFLDKEGRHALSPSLFDRDAYQAQLRRRPEQRGGLRFAVQWKGPNATPLKLRVELRGARGTEPTNAVLEESVEHRGHFSKWTTLEMAGDKYKEFGELIAWRITLSDGSKQLAEQKSFLW